MLSTSQLLLAQGCSASVTLLRQLPSVASGISFPHLSHTHRLPWHHGIFLPYFWVQHWLSSARASQRHSCFAARSRAIASCHNWLQTRIAEASRIRGAPTVRTRPRTSGAAPIMPCVVCHDFHVKSSSRYTMVHVLPASDFPKAL
eukprot:s3438_g12.t1